MTKAINPREIVLGILIEVLENENFSNKVIFDTLKKYQHLIKQDRSFISRVSIGVIEQQILLDYIINEFSNINTKKMKPVIRNILRMGVYQSFFLENIPDSAICNEAVKLAEKKGFKNLKGFVNGILRNIIRENKTIKYPDEKSEPIKYLSVIYSMPEWIVKDFIESYGYNTAKNILTYFLEEKKTKIRVNLNKTTVDELTELLNKQNIETKMGKYLPYALDISNYSHVNGINEFLNGLFTIQDESSMLVGEVANPKQGDFIIDICAAPGGKTTHLAEKLQNTGKISSRDVSDLKVSLIEENVKRLGLLNVETKTFDGLILDKDYIDSADIVIADLPCSGLGVIGKKPDIKYRTTKEDVKNLSLLQRDILKVAKNYVKKDGILIYSTCTLQKEENIENVIWFTDNFPFRLESLDPYIPKDLQCDSTKSGYLELIPGGSQTDGFFIARLRRME